MQAYYYGFLSQEPASIAINSNILKSKINTHFQEPKLPNTLNSFITKRAFLPVFPLLHPQNYLKMGIGNCNEK